MMVGTLGAGVALSFPRKSSANRLPGVAIIGLPTVCRILPPRVRDEPRFQVPAPASRPRDAGGRMRTARPGRHAPTSCLSC